MSTRKVVTIRDPEFSLANPGCTSWQSRAASLIGSGLIDLAGDVTELSHHLTDSVMVTLNADSSERDIYIADHGALRTAIWEGIAFGIIDRLGGKGER